MWKYQGQKRPDFAVEPEPGEESVWDYPRPPSMVVCERLVEVSHGETLIARSSAAIRLLETASPPGFYLPSSDIDWSHLKPADGGSICEWKGIAKYWQLAAEESVAAVAWSYPKPRPSYSELKDYVSFYPGRIKCSVDGEQVRPQPGEFYGGWITSEIAGPFKGDPGTGHW